MEELQSISMERTGKIIRRSIYSFLQNYQYFTCTAALLLFPFSVATLLAQTVVPSSSNLLPVIHARLQSLFDAAGFPSSSQFFSVLNLKLCQTISSSVFTFPFTLSFFLLAKASIIQAFHHHKPACSPSFSLASSYIPILLTQFCNSFFLLFANAAAFALLFFAFNLISAIGLSSSNFLLFLSATGAVIYSIILANALIICNLSLAVAGMENCSGYLSILKACVLIRGRTSTALSLAFPVNLGLAAIEALFQYRVVRTYHLSEHFSTSSMALEGLFIAYLYSILIVLDTIVSCKLYKSCKSSYQINQEGRFYYQMELAEEEDGTIANSKFLEEYP